MSHSYEEQPKLLPCPFCGAKAHFEKDSGGWEWIECESCGMQGNRSASLMEDCKPKLREEWNRRAAPPKAFTASVMVDDGGERPFYCLMAAYKSKEDALKVLSMLSAAE